MMHLSFRLSDCRASLLVLCLFTPAIAWTGLQEPPSLTANARVEREIRGGETHSFRIRLVANHFFYAAVEQRGVDVAVTVTGPDGQRVCRVDSPNGSQGVEPVVLIAAATGDYQLDVAVPFKQAAPGKYEIKIIAWRAAVVTDAAHVAATRAFEEARQTLSPQRTAAARRAALEKYQQALAFFQISGEQYRAALTYGLLGTTWAELGEFQQAAEHFKQALQLYQAVGDRYLEASALNNLGGVYSVLAEPQQALNYYNRALALARTQGNRNSEAAILINIGTIHNSAADWQAGAGFFRQALPLLEALGDQRRQSIALQNLGTAYYFLGRPEQALEHLHQALASRQTSKDKVGEAEVLNNIGYIFLRQKRTTEALTHYERALALWRTAEDRRGEGKTLTFLGGAYLNLGDSARARALFEQALPLLRAMSERRFEALTNMNLGHALAALGEAESALAHYTAALAVFRELNDRQSEAQTLQGMARLARVRGRLDEARTQIEAALSLFEDVRASVNSAQLRTSYLATQQDAYQLHIDLLMQLHRVHPRAGYDALALQASERARARSLLEMLTETKLDLRQGVDASLLAREQELAYQLNAKAERLAQRNTAEQKAALQKELRQIEDAYEQAQAAIRQASPHFAALTQPQPLSLSEIQQQVLDEDGLLLEYVLGAERSYVWAVTKHSLTSYELPTREVIQQAAQRVTALLVVRGTRQRAETAAQRAERIAQADAQLPQAARQLSEMILTPVADQLVNRKLLIVPDGALQYVPFAMLPLTAGKNAGAPLIVQNEIVTLPSASTLAVMRKELAGRRPAPKMLAVFADPVFGNDDERNQSSSARRNPAPSRKAETAPGPSLTERDIVHDKPSTTPVDASGKLLIPRLPFTRQEAERILSVTPDTANLKALGFRASRALATGAELSQYKYLHFATHGLLDTEREGLSALVLSLVDEQGKSQDGFLRAHEIYNLHLPAELVVLSACQTGLGKEYSGEGLVGLTRGFIYAGAARVMVSLWNVNDRATAELMPRFYQKMLKEGHRPAAALRSAQLELWKQKQWTAPYYWAAFVLQGEWQ